MTSSLPAHAGGTGWQGGQHRSTAAARTKLSLERVASVDTLPVEMSWWTPYWATPPSLMSTERTYCSSYCHKNVLNRVRCPLRPPSQWQQRCTSADVARRSASVSDAGSAGASCRVRCHQVLGQSQKRLVAAMRADQAESDRQPFHPRNRQGHLRLNSKVLRRARPASLIMVMALIIVMAGCWHPSRLHIKHSTSFLTLDPDPAPAGAPRGRRRS